VILYRAVCDCHDSPRVHEEWMTSWWWALMDDVFGFTVKNQHPVLVNCGQGIHEHPYRDGECEEILL